MVNFNSTMPLTISFLFLYLPLLFPLFLYFFHCLLLPPHSPINIGLLNTIQHHLVHKKNIIIYTPQFWQSLHIQISWFHSLISKVSQCFKEERRRLHHHHHLHLKILGFELLVVKDSRVRGLEFIMLSIWCNSNLFFNYSYEFIFVDCFILCIS